MRPSSNSLPVSVYYARSSVRNTPNDSDDLQRACSNLNVAENLHRQEVDYNHGNEADGDPDTRVDRTPVADYQRRGRQLGGDGYGVADHQSRASAVTAGLSYSHQSFRQR